MSDLCEKCASECKTTSNAFNYVDGARQEWIFDVDKANRFAREGRCTLVAIDVNAEMLEHVTRNGIIEEHVEHVGPYCHRPAIVARIPIGEAFEEVVIDGNHRIAYLIRYGFDKVPVNLLDAEDTIRCTMLGPGIPMRGELLRLFMEKLAQGV